MRRAGGRARRRCAPSAAQRCDSSTRRTSERSNMPAGVHRRRPPQALLRLLCLVSIYTRKASTLKRLSPVASPRALRSTQPLTVHAIIAGLRCCNSAAWLEQFLSLQAASAPLLFRTCPTVRLFASLPLGRPNHPSRPIRPGPIRLCRASLLPASHRALRTVPSPKQCPQPQPREERTEARRRRTTTQRPHQLQLRHASAPPLHERDETASRHTRSARGWQRVSEDDTAAEAWRLWL